MDTVTDMLLYIALRSLKQAPLLNDRLHRVVRRLLNVLKILNINLFGSCKNKVMLNDSVHAYLFDLLVVVQLVPLQLLQIDLKIKVPFRAYF